MLIGTSESIQDLIRVSPLDRRTPLRPLSEIPKVSEGAAADSGDDTVAGVGRTLEAAPGAGAVAGAHADATGPRNAAPGSAGIHTEVDIGEPPLKRPKVEAPPVAPAPIAAPVGAPSKLDQAQVKAGQDLYDNLQKAPKDASVDHGFAAKIKNPAFEKGKNGKCPKMKDKSPSAESKEIS